VNDREIDEALSKAGQSSQPLDMASLKSVAASIQASMQPVRPLGPTWLLAGAVVLTGAIIATAGAAHAGFFGIQKLDWLERALIFSMLGVFLWAAAREFINQMIPGSRHFLAPGTLLAITALVMGILFAVLFRDYQTTHFLSAGVTCLVVGFLFAVPTGLASWWLLCRGFAVNPVSAGLVAGTLGGLAGVTMLELHCDNFQALHVILWHTAVVPLSAAVGALVGWALRSQHRPVSG
jgi:hypothetical protein